MTSEALTNVAASEDQIVKHLLVDIGTEAGDKRLPTLYGHEPDDSLAGIKRFCLAPMTVRSVAILTNFSELEICDHCGPWATPPSWSAP